VQSISCNRVKSAEKVGGAKMTQKWKKPNMAFES
jgi:hypothetical protein